MIARIHHAEVAAATNWGVLRKSVVLLAQVKYLQRSPSQRVSQVYSCIKTRRNKHNEERENNPREFTKT